MLLLAFVEFGIQNGCLVERFPPSDVAEHSRVIGYWPSRWNPKENGPGKDLGARTFSLTALLGTIAALFGSAMAIVSMVGIFLIIAFANIRSLSVDRSLEATTSASFADSFCSGRFGWPRTFIYTSRRGDLDHDAACVEG